MLVQPAVLIHLYPEMKLGRVSATLFHSAVWLQHGGLLLSAVGGPFSLVQCFAVADSSANVLVPVP